MAYNITDKNASVISNPTTIIAGGSYTYNHGLKDLFPIVEVVDASGQVITNESNLTTEIIDDSNVKVTSLIALTGVKIKVCTGTFTTLNVGAAGVTTNSLTLTGESVNSTVNSVSSVVPLPNLVQKAKLFTGKNVIFGQNSDIIVGAYTNLNNLPNAVPPMQDFETAINRKLDYIHSFAIAPNISAYTTKVKDLRDAGYSVFFTIELVPSYAVQAGPGSLANILAGDFDAQINAFIAQINADVRPAGDKTVLFIEFLHEFNSNFNAWGLTTAGNNPADFVPAYQRIANLFRTGINSDVPYYLCQRWNAPSCKINGEYIKASDYYPGDAYVDIIAFSNYMATGYRYALQHSFETYFDSLYNELAKVTKNPFMIGEMGVAGNGGVYPNLSSGGSGLAANVGVTLPPPPAGGRQAVFSLTISGGVVVAVKTVDSGEGYIGVQTPTYTNLGAATPPTITFTGTYVPKAREIENIANVIKNKYPRVRAATFFNTQPWYPNQPKEKVAMANAIDTLRGSRPLIVRQKEARPNEALDFGVIGNWNITGTNPGAIAISTTIFPDITTATKSLSWSHLGNQLTSKNNRVLQTLATTNLQSLRDCVISFWALGSVDGMMVQGVVEKLNTNNTFDQYISGPITLTTDWKYYEIPMITYWFNLSISVGLQEYASPVQGQGSVAGAIYISNFKVEKGSFATPYLASTGGGASTSTANTWSAKQSFPSSTTGATLALTSSTAPTTPATGDIWLDSGDGLLETYISSSRQSIATSLKDSTYVVRSTVANTVVATPVIARSIPGAYFQFGKNLILNDYGRYSTIGTPTLKFELYYGVTLMASTPVITLVTATNFLWKMENTIRLNGANGTSTAITSGGTLEIWDTVETSTTPVSRKFPFFTNGSVLTDTTILNSLELRVTWGTASASNTIQTRVSTQLAC